jgi:hypothetical protein
MSADIVQRALAKIDEYYEAIENGTVTEDLLVELGDLERAMTDEQRYDFYVGIGAINDDVFEAHPELRGAGKATIVAHGFHRSHQEYRSPHQGKHRGGADFPRV